MFKIDKDIPIPPKITGIGRIYPFDEMKIGDSFAIPYEDDNDARRKQINVSANFRYSRLSQKHFTTRKIKEKKEIRVWRDE